MRTRIFVPMPALGSANGGYLYAPVDQDDEASGDDPSGDYAAVQQRCSELNKERRPRRAISPHLPSNKGMVADIGVCAMALRRITGYPFENLPPALLAEFHAQLQATTICVEIGREQQLLSG